MKLLQYVHTVLSGIVAWAFSSFQGFFISASKGDKYLLVKDLHVAYNL